MTKTNRMPLAVLFAVACIGSIAPIWANIERRTVKLATRVEFFWHPDLLLEGQKRVVR